MLACFCFKATWSLPVLGPLFVGPWRLGVRNPSWGLETPMCWQHGPFPDLLLLPSQPPRHLILLVCDPLQVPVPPHLEELQEVHHHRFHSDRPHHLPGPLHLYLAGSHQPKDRCGLVVEGHGGPRPSLSTPPPFFLICKCIRMYALCRHCAGC